MLNDEAGSLSVPKELSRDVNSALLEFTPAEIDLSLEHSMQASFLTTSDNAFHNASDISTPSSRCAREIGPPDET